MNRPSWKYLIVGVVLAVAMFLSVSQADAFHHRWAWGGYAGCCGPSWGIYSDPCCDFGWYRSWGPVYRVGLLHHRVYAAGWNWGCCDPCGTWDTCCDSGVAVSSCCGGSPVVSGAPSLPTPPTPPTPPAGEQKPTFAPMPGGQTPPPPKPGTGSEIDDLLRPGPVTPKTPAGGAMPSGRTEVLPKKSAVLLTLQVPDDAKVLINGRETKATGTERHYVSYGLKEGKVYPYTVTVLLPNEGNEGVRVSKTLFVKSGDDRRLAFTKDLQLEGQLADSSLDR